MTWRLAIHGGAGLIDRAGVSAPRERAAHQGLRASLEAGSAILRDGGSATDAVVAAIVALEEHPVFNAGRGAVLAEHGEAELDSALMDGSRRFGAVSGVRTTRNPIRLARAVLEDGLHVMLAGPGADRWARAQGLEQVEPAFFRVDERVAQLRRVAGTGGVYLDHDDVSGTVGAVARDLHGHLCAGNSTGGMVNKRAGRVGDTPICGGGTYADDRFCAVAATGHGEPFVRAVAAHRIRCLIELAGLPLEEAARRVLDDVHALGGTGGLVAVGPTGDPVLPFRSGGMYRGVASSAELSTAIW